jgi:hypothetical protein
MTRKSGGTRVAPGFYWSPRRWAIEVVSETEAVLPGAQDESYVRIPVVVMLLAGPVMGALFAIFLPFIGFAMVFRELYRKAVAALRGLPAEAPHPGLTR